MSSWMQAEEFTTKLIASSGNFQRALQLAYPIDHPVWNKPMNFDDWLEIYSGWMANGEQAFNPNFDLTQGH